MFGPRKGMTAMNQWTPPIVRPGSIAPKPKRGMFGELPQPEQAKGANWADGLGMLGAMLRDLDGTMGSDNTAQAKAAWDQHVADQQAKAMETQEMRRQEALRKLMGGMPGLSDQQRLLLEAGAPGAQEAITDQAFATPDPVEYFAPVETENGYAQFSKDGSDPRQFEGIAPAVDLPTGMRMGENGPEYIPQYMEGQERLKAAGRSQVTVNTGDMGAGQRPIVDKPPKGYQRVWDEAESTYRDVPIPGGEAARAEEEANTKAYQAFQADREQMGAIMENIDAADTLINNWTAGAGSLLDSIPATQARDLKARMETVRANIGFDKLNEMRQTSPTGGALGQVTERELNFLQSVRGSLDTGQSPDQLRQTLQEIKASLQRLQEVRQIAFQLQYAEPGQERPQIRTVERPSNDDLPEGFEIVE